MRVAGFDISTYTGMCLLEGDEHRVKCVHFEGMKGSQRLSYLRQEVNRTLDLWLPEYALLENYAIGHKSSVVDVVSCGTIIRDTLFQRGLSWYEIRPTSLKKWTTGKGNAKKPEMATSVKQRWGFESASDDIVDAYALARFGQLGPEEMLKVVGVVVGQ